MDHALDPQISSPAWALHHLSARSEVTHDRVVAHLPSSRCSLSLEAAFIDCHFGYHSDGRSSTDPSYSRPVFLSAQVKEGVMSE